MKKLKKVLILGVAGACLLSGGMFLSACKKKPVNTPITVEIEEGVVLSRYKDENSWTVSSFSPTATTVNIPDEYSEMPVTKINEGVKLSEYVQTVTVGKNITVLSRGLFENCVNLTRLDYNAVDANVINESTHYIAPIFGGLTGSEQSGFVLNIGVEVEQIPDYFMATAEHTINIFNNGVLRPNYAMPKLKQINMPENGALKSIGAFAFIGCNTINQTLTLPTSLESIGAYAFAFSGVSGVLNLSNNINHINSYAFLDTKITQVNFNAQVTDVNNSAFETETLEIVTFNSCFETANGDVFGDSTVNIVVTNANMAKLNTVYSMAPNGFAHFYITTDIAQSEINSAILANTTYIETVILGGEQYYHYQ